MKNDYLENWNGTSELKMKYYIKTFGCQMNESDSERIASFFDSQKLQETKNIKKADLVLFNTCGVRQTAEDRVYGQVHNLRTWNIKHGTNCKIIVTGCLAHRKDFQKRLEKKVDMFFKIKDLKEIENWLIENSLKNENCKLKILDKNKQENKKQSTYFSIKPNYKNKDSAFIPIMTGCNNFCSYCVVPYARGREKSRPLQDIFQEIEKLSEKKYKEIILLGQNVNSYFYNIQSQKSKVKTTTKNSKLKNWKLIGNLDLEIDSKLVIGKNKKDPNYKLQITNYKTITFPVLLNTLAKSFPNIKFHFLTSHPKDFSEDLMKVIAENKNVSKEIHLPIQSGSKKILKAMNRPYTQKKYLNLIEKAQKIITGVTFTTDVIVGFPGETEKDFQETIKVFKKVNYTEAYINKYSPRPETAALKLGDPIPWDEKKRREKCLRTFIEKKSR